MTSSRTKRAVFLDRDGVLNRNVFYADTGCFESPRCPADFVLAPRVIEGLDRLRAAGFLLILVSNQPNAAKQKVTFELLAAIHAQLEEQLAASGHALDRSFYCYHHPDFTGPCACRKPGTYFLEQAAEEFGLSLPACWMIGDRATDVDCGRRAGTRTVWIDTGEGSESAETADLVAGSLFKAAQLICASV